MCLTTSNYNDPNSSNSLYKILATTTTIPTYIHYGDFVTIENLALQSGTIIRSIILSSRKVNGSIVMEILSVIFVKCYGNI